MSSPHIHVQNTTVRDINPEKYLRLRGNSTLPQIPRPSSRTGLHNGEDNMRDINGQIAKHLKTSEQSLLIKYLAERKVSPLHINDGARSYLRTIESMDSGLMRPGGRRMKSYLTPDIARKVTELQSKHSDRILPTHTEAWDMKPREKTSLRERISGVSSQGDASIRKYTKALPSFKYLQPPTQRTENSLKVVDPPPLENTESEPHAVHPRMGPERGHSLRLSKGVTEMTESARRRYNLYSELRSRSTMPRLVSSDLSDRRTKANFGKTSKMEDIGEMGLEQALALLEGELHERQVEMDIGACNGLRSPRLRECVSDAKVTRSGSQGSKRPRSRKPTTPPKSRGSRVRNPRSLANFLRAGFHPPEPGKSGRRCVDWGPLPGVKPLVENMLNRCMAMTAGPGGDRSPPTSVPKPSLAAESQPPSTLTMNDIRTIRRGERLGVHRAEVSSRATTASLNTPPIADRPVTQRSFRRGGGIVTGGGSSGSGSGAGGGGGRPDVTEIPASPPASPELEEGSSPLDAYFPPEQFVSTTNFGQTLRNRRGRPVKGPPSYRSIPVLRGNLFLTMPSISEENEEKEWDDEDEEEEEVTEDREERDEASQITEKDEDDADEKKAEWLRRSEEERERHEQWNKKRLEEVDRRKYVEEERRRRQEQEEERIRERDQRRREEQERRKRLEEEEERKLEDNLKVISEFEKTGKFEKERKLKEEQEKRRVELEQMEKKALESLRRTEANEGGTRGKWERVQNPAKEGKSQSGGKEGEGKEKLRRTSTTLLTVGMSSCAGGRRSPTKYAKGERGRARRALQREVAAEAERKVAEKVLGRWAQKHVANMQRRATLSGGHSSTSHGTTSSSSGHHHHHHHHRSTGGSTEAPTRKRKVASHKKDSRKKEGSRNATEAKAEPLGKALRDLWQSAKIAAVRQGEKELLARAANILDTKLSR